MNHGLSSQGGNPLLRAGSLEELLSYHGRDFVRCAFVSLLGRVPDAEGEAHWLFLLASGRSPLEILWRLRSSDEGQAHDPGIRHLDRDLRRAALMRVPVLGSIARLLWNGRERDRVEDRQARATLEALYEIARPKTLLAGPAQPFGGGDMPLDDGAPLPPEAAPSEGFVLPAHLRPSSGLQSSFVSERGR